MINNCDENEEIMYENRFRLIQIMISHTGTPNNGGSHYFVMVTMFTMQTTTIMSL